jgi:Fe-S-cluster-containing dehydrogenase component
MVLDRRAALKLLATGVGGAAAAATAPLKAHARAPAAAPEGAASMLFDTTLCIGCQACTVACRDANEIRYEETDGIYFNAVDLSAGAKSVIKLTGAERRQTYMKMQCMHCVDPACVNACMFGAFQKRDHGVVTWKGEHCTGCRYCEIACPFDVPRFEWEAWNPRMVKCELCSHRLAEGGIPACVEVCPREAIIYGTREELLEEAHRRIAARPDRYLGHVYGEHEGGGTQVLYLSDIPFEELGLPVLGTESLPARVHRVQGTLYKGFVLPLALYAVLGTVIARNRRKEKLDAERTGHASSGELEAGS